MNEDLFLFYNWSILTSSEIAKILKRKKQEVRDRIVFLNLRDEPEETEELGENLTYKTFYCFFIKTYCQDMNAKTIIELLGISTSTFAKVQKILKTKKIVN